MKRSCLLSLNCLLFGILTTATHLPAAASSKSCSPFRSNLAIYRQDLANFQATSAFVVDTGVTFSADAKATMLEVLPTLRTNQAFFKFNFDPATEQVAAQSGAGPDLYLDTRNGSDAWIVHERIPPEVFAKLTEFMKDLSAAILEARGPDYVISGGEFRLRATSNVFGHRITREMNGDPITGLHNHMNDSNDRYEFGWAIHRLGTIAKVEDRWIGANEEGQALIFGGLADHGSGDSDEMRIVGLGKIWIAKMPR